MKQRIYIGIFLTILLITAGCDHWDDTADVSHVTYLPEFEFIGGNFISYVQSNVKYTDPGIRVLVNGEPVNWYYLSQPPDSLNEPGIYIIQYYAENTEGFSKTAERIVAVTYEDVSNNNLAGTYSANIFGYTESRVTRIDDKGLYKSEDVLGFPGAPMPGRFVDLGENNLVLLPGEGYFGRYDVSEGSYTKTILAWSVILLDPPNTGVEVPVTWRKID